MTQFIGNCPPDPECRGRSLPWVTSKTLFVNAIVAHAPPYPEFPKLKTSKVVGATSDPSSPFAKVPSDKVEVIAYSSENNGAVSAQEQAWQFIGT